MLKGILLYFQEDSERVMLCNSHKPIQKFLFIMYVGVHKVAFKERWLTHTKRSCTVVY